MGNKLSNVEQILKKKERKKVVCDDRENHASPGRDSVHYGATGDCGSRAVCRKTAAVEPQFFECAVNMFRESS